ncbi:hypothetical protein OQ496_09890 [Acetobacter suratthaniensis]|uniref:Uncharacterized protein n=1 Tax=Acetobacter suratthaniensis TaxID=1502841 RepID=A0ABS3LMH1_9PROT|nr:hypothetical protein [Acetobacter suratthaniensis]MBO1328559.1 hypothetical protein [Acetobacter suratthaniensis]MCX2566770.1 hypothetical protein [Acetobacter suratthaniensis]
MKKPAKKRRHYRAEKPLRGIAYALPLIGMLLAGCADDHGRGAMHEAVSGCFIAHPLQKGSAYDRFRCIALAHQHYGPAAIGENYGLIVLVDQAALSIGQEIDSGTLDLPAAETALHWVTIKAQQATVQPASISMPPAHQAIPSGAYPLGASTRR